MKCGEKAYSWSGKPSVVCKKNVPIYNNVTQTEAKSVAREFINNDNVKSALISGIQWDVMLGFVDGSNDGMGHKFEVNVFYVNRHITFLQYSGFNKYDKVKNIYDLEGNVCEWTAERYVNDQGDWAPYFRRRNAKP